MSDRWQEMAVFVRVADTGNLSRAARELNLSQPSVTRIVGTLEARLGTKLLLRTTRSMSLTDAGTLYLERARYLLAEMEEADQATRGIDSLHGVIRIAMPLMYGTRAVIPALTTFLARYPDLKVELFMSDVRQNLITDGGGSRHSYQRRTAGRLVLRCPQACACGAHRCRSAGISVRAWRAGQPGGACST